MSDESAHRKQRSWPLWPILLLAVIAGASFALMYFFSSFPFWAKLIIAAVVAILWQLAEEVNL